MSMRFLTVKLYDLGMLGERKQADMGIPVNENCTLVQEGARGAAYLDNGVVVVIWTITAEGDKKDRRAWAPLERLSTSYVTYF